MFALGNQMSRKGKHVLQAMTFDQDFESWDTFPVNDMNLMVPGAGAFNHDIGTGGVSSMNAFLNRFFQQRYIGTFDVPNVTGMIGMFNGAFHINQDNEKTWVHRILEFVHYEQASTTFRLISLTAW
jgi:Mycoplasma protein of unknown function, DUF285